MLNLFKFSVLAMALVSVCPNDNPTVVFPLASTHEEKTTLNFPDTELSIYCSSKDYKDIQFYMWIRSDTVMTIYPERVRIFHIDREIDYHFKTDTKKTGSSAEYLIDHRGHFLYRSISAQVDKSNDIYIYADSLLAIGADYFGIDALKYSVANAGILIYK